MNQYQPLTDQLHQPAPALTVLGTGSVMNYVVDGLPIFINAGMAIYVVFIVVLKGIELYKTLIKNEDEPKE